MLHPTREMRYASVISSKQAKEEEKRKRSEEEARRLQREKEDREREANGEEESDAGARIFGAVGFSAEEGDEKKESFIVGANVRAVIAANFAFGVTL